ncbi:MAG: hypothetical protein EOO43_04995 [Flavobacterium sp.]|nr:MAG: hypothetical protein EOO43_04995 [Flavobacterium sp.]
MINSQALVSNAIIILALVGCNRYDSKNQNILIGDEEEKYWDVYRTDQSSVLGCYRFASDGEVTYFRYDKATKKRVHWIVDDSPATYSYILCDTGVTIDGTFHKSVIMKSNLLILNSKWCENCYEVLVPFETQDHN